MAESSKPQRIEIDPNGEDVLDCGESGKRYTVPPFQGLDSKLMRKQRPPSCLENPDGSHLSGLQGDV
jgi:hypothetical protein